MKKDSFRLREMTEDDLEMVLAWRNSEQVRAFMYTDHVITLEEHRSWFARVKDDPTAVFLICEEDGVAIGAVNFVQIDTKNNKAYWGFYLGAENVARGRGSIMEFLALEYAFNTLGLRKLCGEAFAFNEHVLKLHKKFGFQEEGCLRAHMLKNGKFEDVIPIGIFAEEWSRNRERLAKVCFRERTRTP